MTIIKFIGSFSSSDSRSRLGTPGISAYRYMLPRWLTDKVVSSR